MKEIKNELIKEFLEYFEFDLEKFKITELPIIKGYALKDKNNENIIISKPLFTENLIMINLDNQDKYYLKKLCSDGKYHFIDYKEKENIYL